MSLSNLINIVVTCALDTVIFGEKRFAVLLVAPSKPALIVHATASRAHSLLICPSASSVITSFSPQPLSQYDSLTPFTVQESSKMIT